MRITNLTFEKWKENHSVNHDDKWCRELYPFHIFKQIDFDDKNLNIEQEIEYNWISYYVTIRRIEIQENGRFRTTFDFSTTPKSKSQQWKNRIWNTTFQLVYTDKYDFITIFTKKEDPSKDLVIKFMKGNFYKIDENRSLPISELLFKTLILQLSDEAFPDGKHNEMFKFDSDGIRTLAEHPQFKRKKVNFFAPIYSINRDLWICYSFSEEKAHRVAFYNANQCHKLIVIYCNPTYTKHHRCKYDSTLIFSLYEFSNIISYEIKEKYDRQIKFLQNHLNKVEESTTDQILREINDPKQDFYEISKSDLMEAFSIMKIIPSNNDGFFHSLAALNLINAFLTRQRNDKTLKSKYTDLFRNMYYFKTYLSEIITDRINKGDYSAPIYIDGEIIMIEIMGFQFSFHNVPLNEILKGFKQNIHNREIFWSGKRLQPISPLILKYSRALRQEK